MLGPTLAILSAAASGFSVVIVGRHSTESNAFNMSVLISAVGLAILWPLAFALTDFSAVNLAGIALFAVGGFLTPGLVRLFYYNGLKKLGTSVNSSIFSIYPVYTAFLASLVLSEILTPQNWMGVFSIVVGVVFVELTFKGNNNSPRALTRSLAFPNPRRCDVGCFIDFAQGCAGSLQRANPWGSRGVHCIILVVLRYARRFKTPTTGAFVETGFTPLLARGHWTSVVVDFLILRLEL